MNTVEQLEQVASVEEVEQIAPVASPSINGNKLQLYSIKPDNNNKAKYYAFFKIGETNNIVKLYLSNTDYSCISNGKGEKMCFLTLNNETPYRIKIIAENAIKLVKIINQNYVSEYMENTIESYRKMSDSERTKIIESNNHISITALQKNYYESFSINVEVMDEGVNSNRVGGASKSRKSRRTRKSRKSKKSGKKSRRNSRR